MTENRTYLPSRDVYFPRLWPMAVVGALIVVPGVLFLDGVVGVLGIIAWSALVGVTVPAVRLWVWRRRHPRIPPQQRIEARRRAAPWN